MATNTPTYQCPVDAPVEVLGREVEAGAALLPPAGARGKTASCAGSSRRSRRRCSRSSSASSRPTTSSLRTVFDQVPPKGRLLGGRDRTRPARRRACGRCATGVFTGAPRPAPECWPSIVSPAPPDDARHDVPGCYRRVLLSVAGRRVARWRAECGPTRDQVGHIARALGSDLAHDPPDRRGRCIRSVEVGERARLLPRRRRGRRVPVRLPAPRRRAGVVDACSR